MKKEDFKAKFDLVAYVKDGGDYTERGDDCFICCPFHHETTPSCLISKDRWYCFGGCGAGGDSIDFLMKTTGKSFTEVLSSGFESKYVIDENAPTHKSTKIRTISPSLMSNYCARLLRNPSKIEYLVNRGFDLESIKLARIGYGIPVDVHGWKFKHARYAIPHFFEGKIVGVKYRIDPIFEKVEPEKYISHPGVNGTIYNMDVLVNEQKLIYVGSQFDAAVLWYRYGIPAICPPSENIFRDEWIPLFVNKSVLIWLDNDEAGVNGALKVYNKVKNVTKHADIFTWGQEFGKKDDFTDYLKKYGIDEVKKVYDNHN